MAWKNKDESSTHLPRRQYTYILTSLGSCSYLERKIWRANNGWERKMWRANNGWEVNLLTVRIYLRLISQPCSCRKTFTAGERILGYLLACVVRALPLDFTDSHFCFTFFLRENAGVCAPSFSAPRVTITLAIQYSCSTILPVAIVWAHIPVTESSA